MQHSIFSKISIILLALFFSLHVFAKTSDEKNVESLIQQVLSAYEHRDVNAFAKFYSPTAVAIGTGSDEVIQGRKNIVAAFQRDFKESTDSKLSTQKIAVDIQGNVALVSYYLNVKVQIPNSAPFESKLRWTLTLLKENNLWLIVQSHLSAPLVSEREGESFPHTPKQP